MNEIRRNFDNENPLLNSLLDDMCARLKELGVVMEETKAVGASELVNNGGTVIYAGLFIGFNSGGSMVTAGGSGTFVRAVSFCVKQAAPGEKAGLVTTGLQRVSVEPGQIPAAGDPGWLSVSKAGNATPTRPTGTNSAQLVGSFLGGVEGNDGKALFLLNIDLTVTKRT